MAKGKIKGEVFFTSGQAAKALRISVSTLKRWLNDGVIKEVKQNSNGWRLFSEADIETLRIHQQKLKKQGKRFKSSTLQPV